VLGSLAAAHRTGPALPLHARPARTEQRAAPLAFSCRNSLVYAP
jgi:hypothetical protein